MTSPSAAPPSDPLALRPDGSAADPAAFRAHLLADPAVVADLAAADPAALAVLRSGADGPLQELLKAVYAVRREERRGEREGRVRGGGRAGRGGDGRAAVMTSKGAPSHSTLPPFLLNHPRSSARPPSSSRKRSAGPSTRRAPCRSAPSTPSARPRPCHGKRRRGAQHKQTGARSFPLDLSIHSIPPQPLLSIPSSSLSHITHSDTVQLYQQLAASGLQYGPAFRLLRNVHVPEVE